MILLFIIVSAFVCLLGGHEPLANVRYAHEFPGLDAGQQITNAIADLPSTGGTVDARGLMHPQTLSSVTVPAGVALLLPPINFTVSETIVVRPSGHLIGGAWGNPGQTSLVAAPSLEGEVIHAAGESPGDWWHYGSIQNVRVVGSPGGPASTNCITVEQMGEASLLRNLHLAGCRVSGLRINGSQAGSGRIDGISIFHSGQDAVRLHDATSGMIINSLSGDRNPVFLRITGSRDGGVGLVLLDLKVEGTLNQSDPVIWIDNSRSNVHLTVIGGTSIASAPRDEWIRITNTGPGAHPFIEIVGTRISTKYANIVNDQGFLAPLESSRISHFIYGRSGTRFRVAKGRSLYQDLVLFQGGPNRTNFNEWRSRTGKLLRSVRKSGLAVPLQSDSPPEPCTEKLAGAQYYGNNDQQLCTCRHDGTGYAWVLQSLPTHEGHCAGN